MDFENFKIKCMTLLDESGEEIDVRFSNEDGKYIAVFSNGVRIVGNSICLSVRVFWGSGHAATARI